MGNKKSFRATRIERGQSARGRVYSQRSNPCWMEEREGDWQGSTEFLLWRFHVVDVENTMEDEGEVFGGLTREREVDYFLGYEQLGKCTPREWGCTCSFSDASGTVECSSSRRGTPGDFV